MVMDKECIICGVNELDTIQMFEHWDEDHGLAMNASVEMWNAALEEYDETDNELEFTSEPSTYSPGQEGSPTMLARDGHVHRQSNPSDTSVSQAVSTAFQENMRPLRKDIEDKLNFFRREILGQDENGTLHNVADNVKKLATASSTCSDKMSQIVKNSSENGTTMNRISTYQTEHSVKFDTLNSAILNKDKTKSGGYSSQK